MAARALWFGPPSRPLFGRFYAPAHGLARGGVLLCPPFDLEAQEVALAYRRVAEELQRRRLAVLHFDYDGTGDSAGGAGDTERVMAWQNSIVEAVNFLRSGGIDHVAAIGMRFGATLTASVAARCGVDALVLWDPCESGRSYLREQALLRAVHGADQAIQRTTSPGDAVKYVETLGNIYGAETVAQMSALVLENLPGPFAPSVLALLRPERTPRRGLINRLSQENVELGAAPGQDELLSAWTVRSVVPDAAIASVAAWLDRLAPSTAFPFDVAGRTTATLKRPGQQAVVERVEVSRHLGLFMISTEPHGSVSQPTIVFLNSGRTDHTGPGRLWVDLARHWAALGLRVVRADLSGLGSSPARPGQDGDRAYPTDAVDDIRDIALSACPANPSDVVLVGLCSGGYHAAMAALQMPVRGVVAINPGFPAVAGESRKTEDIAPAQAGPAAAPSRPTRLLQAKASGKAWLRSHLPRYDALKRPARMADEMKWWVINRKKGGTRPAEVFKRLVATGATTLVIFRPYEAEVFTRGEHSLLRRLRRQGSFRLEIADGTDHTLYFQCSRRQIVPMLTRFMLAATGSSPSMATAEEVDNGPLVSQAAGWSYVG